MRKKKAVLNRSHHLQRVPAVARQTKTKQWLSIACDGESEAGSHDATTTVNISPQVGHWISNSAKHKWTNNNNENNYRMTEGRQFYKSHKHHEGPAHFLHKYTTRALKEVAENDTNLFLSPRCIIII